MMEIDNIKNNAQQEYTEYAIFANHKETGEFIICTGLHKTSYDAEKEFAQLINDGRLQYIDPSTKEIQSRVVEIKYNPWQIYRRPDIGALPVQPLV